MANDVPRFTPTASLPCASPPIRSSSGRPSVRSRPERLDVDGGSSDRSRLDLEAFAGACAVDPSEPNDDACSAGGTPSLSSAWATGASIVRKVMNRVVSIVVP